MFKSFIKAVVFGLIVFNLSCSKVPPSKAETILEPKVEATMERGKELQKLLKEENYVQIYRDSADCTRSNYSEAQFINVMKEAVEKLKSIDENLEFLDLDFDERSFDDNWRTYQNYGIGYEVSKIRAVSNQPLNPLPKDENHARILTAWQNDENYKLTAFRVLFKDKWYGTSSCTTTQRKTFVENGVKQTETTFATDR